MATRTTININKEVRDALQKVRKYPRETYDDVLLRLVKKQLKVKEIKKTLKTGK
jgi:predicted CopG family antitoxin